MTTQTIVGICGSTRKASYNHALLKAISAYLPESIHYAQSEITDLPFFNQELEASLPSTVVSFAEQIRSAQAVIISTPEYNYSFPGVLKHALEWVSRPSMGDELAGNLSLLMCASPGLIGPARGLLQLRQVLFGCKANVLNRPEIQVNDVMHKINVSGEVTDPKLAELLQQGVSSMLSVIPAHS